MKQFVLVLVLGVLLTGCRENYLAEKAFWKANRTLQRIPQSEVAAKNIAALQPAIEQFEKVFYEYPSSPKAAESLFFIAHLHEKLGQTKKSLEMYDQVIQNFSHTHNYGAEARYQIALLFEQGDHWEKAEKAYWELAENHPLADRGLFAPIHIMIHHKIGQNEALEKVTYTKAIEFYNRILRDLGEIKGSALILHYIALAHLGHGDWRLAGEVWRSIIDDYPQTAEAPKALLASAELYWKHENYADAEDYFNEFFKKFPDYNRNAQIAERIGKLYDRKQEYAKAREWFDKAIGYLGRNKQAIAGIESLKVRGYIIEENWKSTEDLLELIESKYKTTDAALQVPLLRSVKLEAEGRKEEAKKVINEAIATYQRMEAKERDPAKLNLAKRLLHAALIRKGDWKSILNNFDQYMESAKTEQKKAEWLFMKAYITERQIKDEMGALSIYEDFIEKYPQHNLIKTAKTRKEILVGAV